LPTSWQTADARTAREQAAKAREAAEALFQPRQPAVRREAPIAVANAPSAAEHAPARAPRILAARSPMPARDEPIARGATATPKRKRAASERRLKKIPSSHHGRIRTLATYGMTLEQLAELYDAPVSDIEKITGAV
jgi:hypothetical protein